jgi:Zn-dependent metalloprotease
MKNLPNIQKIIIVIALIAVSIIIWQFFRKSADISPSITTSLKDTTFINYVLRENENKLLKENNENLKQIILENNSQRIIYLSDIQNSKQKISENEKTNIENNVVVNDSTIWNFSNKLTQIRLGN